MVGAGKYLLQQKRFGKVEDLSKDILMQFVNFDPDVTVLQNVLIFRPDIAEVALL